MPAESRIESFVVAPRRRLDGRPADGIAPAHGDEHPSSVTIRAHRGIVGDRYFGSRFTYAALTIIAAEQLERLAETLDDGPFDPRLARRNVVTRGVDVDALVRSTFTLDSGDGPIRFRSITPANPCAWMEHVYAPGARAALRGHAGIRCEPLDDGTLRVGPLTICDVAAIAPEDLRRQVAKAPIS